MTLRIATRGSRLARAQSAQVGRMLSEELDEPFELVLVSTRGDRSGDPLARIGGTGVFVAEVREAVLRDEADIAVHSLKDLPTAPVEGLVLAAVPVRGPANDVLVTVGDRQLEELRPGASVGTGSPRREAQLRLLRPDLRVVPLRGNVDTRLGFVEREEMDAVVLARAGLERASLAHRISQVLSVRTMLPAPGQGALALEVAVSPEKANLVRRLGKVDHGNTRASVTAERSLLATLEAGCTAPVGAHADVDADGSSLTLVAAALDPGGGPPVRRVGTSAVTDAWALGGRVAEQLLADGAGSLLTQAR